MYVRIIIDKMQLLAAAIQLYLKGIRYDYQQTANGLELVEHLR